VAKLSLEPRWPRLLCINTTPLELHQQPEDNWSFPNNFPPPSNSSSKEMRFDGEASDYLRELEKDRKEWRTCTRPEEKLTSNSMARNGGRWHIRVTPFEEKDRPPYVSNAELNFLQTTSSTIISEKIAGQPRVSANTRAYGHQL
jgi:hypothetical protein